MFVKRFYVEKATFLKLFNHKTTREIAKMVGVSHTAIAKLIKDGYTTKSIAKKLYEYDNNLISFVEISQAKRRGKRALLTNVSPETRPLKPEEDFK